MFHIVICDDDKMFIEFMKEIIIEAGISAEEVLFYEYLSGEELIYNMDKQTQCDLIIIDMQMKQLDGQETAMRFREKFPRSTLVFCSGVCKPTDESFKAMPFRYLLKNYAKDKLLSEMQSVVQEIMFKQTGPLITGKYYYSTVRLKTDDILYIENSRYGSIIHVYKCSTQFEYEGDIKTKKKLAELMEELHAYGFEFAHNSYIVNLKYVVKMQSNGEITLCDGTKLNVSRSKLKDFRKAFSEWISRKY